MEWEEDARKLKAANERRQALEKYVMLHPNQAGDEYCELLEVRDQVASLTFRRDWGLQQDRCAVGRSE
jgi:hypothetical protein